ncbi:MAG: hypothetical protein J0665_07190 [Deltaproteobacteria bacterium]|nr:hypothetical protein [Deltaproteobacteria bacterium]
MRIKSYLLFAAVAVSLSACGGGGGDLIEAPPSTVVASSQTLTPGSTYKLVFSAISTAQLPAPIGGIEVAAQLPAGLSVSTVSGTEEIAASSITSGSDVQWSPSGSYVSSTGIAHLNMATTQSTYRGGQYLKLLFTVAAGTSVTPGDITTLNATYPSYKVTGYDATTSSSVDMTNIVKTTLTVER